MSEAREESVKGHGAWRSLARLLPNPFMAVNLIMTTPTEIERRLEATPAFLQAREFRDTIEVVEGAEYDWVWDYAKDKFARLERIYKEIDDKANDIIKYLGGGTGLFTLGLLANVTALNFWIIASAIPSFMLALFAIALAASARQPYPAGEPPSVRNAFRLAGEHKKGKAAFLGQWHLACAMMVLSIAGKAVRVEQATKFFVWTIASLAIPIIAAIW